MLSQLHLTLVIWHSWPQSTFIVTGDVIRSWRLVNWFRSYLGGRKHHVPCGTKFSTVTLILCGVPCACTGGAENAGVENAGVENAGVDSRGGKCRSGKCRSRQSMESCKNKYSHVSANWGGIKTCMQRFDSHALVPCGYQRFCESCVNEVHNQGRGCSINMLLRVY